MSEKKTKVLSLGKKYTFVYEKCKAKASKIAPDKKKIGKNIKKARKIFERLHNIPRFDKFSKHICDFCDLLSDYCDGAYTNLPVATLVALIAGVLYVVLPIDVLADFIPLLGWLDDAAVLSFIVKTEQNDVNEYLRWKETTLLKDIHNDSEPESL